MRNNLPSVEASSPFLHAVVLVGEFGELSHAHHAVAIDQERRRNFGVAVLARRASRAGIGSAPAPAARPSLCKEESRCRKAWPPRAKSTSLRLSQNSTCVLGLKSKSRLLAPNADFSTLSAADLPSLTFACGKLGNCSIKASRCCFRLGAFLVQFGDACAHVARLGLFGFGFGGFLSAPSTRQSPWKRDCASALSCSTSARALRRRSSKAEQLVDLFFVIPPWRVARRWRTKSVFSRINRISSIGAL